MGGFGGVAPGAFGGRPGSLLTEEEQNVICGLKKALPSVISSIIMDWIVAYLSNLVNGNSALIIDELSDPDACKNDPVTPLAQKSTPKPFAISGDGYPVSSNEIFNTCLRGERLTVAQVRYNPENPDHLSCGDFTHQKGVWYHPDYHVYFTWDKTTKKLGVPDGFYAYALPYNVVQK